jgi:hypothetical protein
METLFDTKLPEEIWVKKHLKTGFKAAIESQTGFGVEWFELKTPIKPDQHPFNNVQLLIESFSHFEYRDVAAFYDYTSRLHYRFINYYESSEDMRRVIRMEGYFNDFILDNPIYGEWEYAFTMDLYLNTLITSMLTRKYCEQDPMLSIAFQEYMHTYYPKWLADAYTHMRGYDALKFYLNLKNQKRFKLPTIVTYLSALATEHAKFLPEHGFMNMYDICDSIAACWRRECRLYEGKAIRCELVS